MKFLILAVISLLNLATGADVEFCKSDDDCPNDMSPMGNTCGLLIAEVDVAGSAYDGSASVNMCIDD